MQPRKLFWCDQLKVIAKIAFEVSNCQSSLNITFRAMLIGKSNNVTFTDGKFSHFFETQFNFFQLSSNSAEGIPRTACFRPIGRVFAHKIAFPDVLVTGVAMKPPCRSFWSKSYVKPSHIHRAFAFCSFRICKKTFRSRNLGRFRHIETVLTEFYAM